jgi:hypothetical protein
MGPPTTLLQYGRAGRYASLETIAVSLVTD